MKQPETQITPLHTIFPKRAVQRGRYLVFGLGALTASCGTDGGGDPAGSPSASAAGSASVNPAPSASSGLPAGTASASAIASAAGTGTSPPSATGGPRPPPTGSASPQPSTAPSSTSMPPAGVKFVGNINVGDNDPTRLVPADFASMWNQITPENEGKWGTVEGNRDAPNWAKLDAIYAYAEQHGLIFKLHTFVWGSQQPGWVTNFNTSSASGKAELKAEVEEYMQQSCERYPNVGLIDVVNEPPPHTTPTTVIDALGGAGASGYDWVVEAFHLARKYCPNATLIFNDYNNIEYDTADNQQNFLKIARAAKDAGAPIDALGAQAHDAYKLKANDLKRLIDNLAGVGLPLYITEYDINEADDAKQQSIMAEQFPIFWNDDRIHGITLWGYVYGRTWKADTGLQRNGQARPALTWLLDYLRQQGAL